MSEEKPEATEDPGPGAQHRELIRRIAARVRATYNANWRHFQALGLEVIDTGGKTDEDRETVHRVIDVVKEAGERIREMLGFEENDGRDLGSYGVVYHAGGLPKEFEVEYECIVRSYTEAVFAWQEKCAHWRANQALDADTLRIVEEELAPPTEPEQPKKRRARKARQGPQEKPSSG